MSIIKQELDFSDSKVHMSHGSYRYMKILPMTGVQTPTLSKTSPSLVSFELNPRVYNLAKSVLNFDLKFTAPAAGHANRFYLTGASVIDSLSIQTRNGTYLCQLNSGANNFFYSTCNPTKPMDKFWTSDIYQTSTAGNTQTCGGYGREILNNSNIVVSTAGAAYADLVVTALARTLDVTAQPAKYVQSGTAADMTVRCQLKFSDWIHTLFACDKNLFFNESLTVTVGFASTDRYCYDYKIADGAIIQVVTLPTMSNLAIYLATEQDLGVIQSITNQVNSTGITMKVPFVYSLKTPGAANLTINQRLASNQGQKLLKAYTNIVNSTETLGTAYTPGTTTNVQYLRSAIDNIYSQDNQLDRKVGEWYLYQKDSIKGSAVLSSDIYENWLTWCDNYTGSTTFAGAVADSYDDGLDIQQQEKIYSLNLVGDGTYIAYTYFVLQRTLFIKSGSIMIQ